MQVAEPEALSESKVDESSIIWLDYILILSLVFVEPLSLKYFAGKIAHISFSWSMFELHIGLI
jgi:hypothetical protein